MFKAEPQDSAPEQSTGMRFRETASKLIDHCFIIIMSTYPKPNDRILFHHTKRPLLNRNPD
jgi:hypothetical protein